MIRAVAEYPVGSIWSVLGVEDGRAVVLAGPFAASRGSPEYLVAPLYAGSESGFVWTSEDVRLNPEETSLGVRLYAAVWNARPVLEVDLLFRLGQCQDEATIVVRDAYWASLNERRLGKSPRLGRRIRSTSDTAAQFQARELRKWQQVSGRALQSGASVSASATFVIGEPWSLTVEDVASLARNIEQSEVLLLPLKLAAVGPARVSFTATLYSSSVSAPLTEHANFFAFPPSPSIVGSAVWQGNLAGLRLQISKDGSQELATVAANSELALAA